MRAPVVGCLGSWPADWGICSIVGIVCVTAWGGR